MAEEEVVGTGTVVTAEGLKTLVVEEAGVGRVRDLDKMDCCELISF